MKKHTIAFLFLLLIFGCKDDVIDMQPDIEQIPGDYIGSFTYFDKNIAHLVTLPMYVYSENDVNANIRIEGDHYLISIEKLNFPQISLRLCDYQEYQYGTQYFNTPNNPYFTKNTCVPNYRWGNYNSINRFLILSDDHGLSRIELLLHLISSDTDSIFSVKYYATKI